MERKIDLGDCMGIVRQIDVFGRVVIPKEFRKMIGIKEGDCCEIFALKDNSVLIRKAPRIDK